jgi:hypothetical protein
MSASAYGLTTPRATDWRTRGSCSSHGEPDIWFAGRSGTDAREQTREAQAICYGCPVIQQCGQWAIAEHEIFGVWGGMTEDQRRRIFRRRGITVSAGDSTKARTKAKPRAATLQAAWKKHTRNQPPGHIVWDGPRVIYFNNREYTPTQVAFVVDRGREPNGAVRRTCGLKGCVLPAHLADTAERQQRAKAAKAAA